MRALLLAFLLLIPGLAAAQPAEWRDFARRYLAADGRIIDTGNAGISHSEGQGYAMLFAVEYDDRPAFERMWAWTRATLARPNDALFAWRFVPNAGLAVRDLNNATDGDIFVAWALARAAARWNAPEHLESAQRIARDVLACCVVEAGGRTVMLPGAAGFRRPEGVVVNLSYYNFAAIRALSRVAPSPRWAALERDGLAMIADATFGGWRLPPDWLLVPADGGRVAIAAGWPPRFAWDAVRVPLNIAWMRGEAGDASSYLAWWGDRRHRLPPPAWADLRTNQVSPYRGHAGVVAVQAAVRRAGGDAAAPLPRVADAPDYFGAALVLQARMMLAMAPEPPPLVPPEPEAPSGWRAIALLVAPARASEGERAPAAAARRDSMWQRPGWGR